MDDANANANTNTNTEAVERDYSKETEKKSDEEDSRVVGVGVSTVSDEALVDKSDSHQNDGGRDGRNDDVEDNDKNGSAAAAAGAAAAEEEKEKEEESGTGGSVGGGDKQHESAKEKAGGDITKNFPSYYGGFTSVNANPILALFPPTTVASGNSISATTFHPVTPFIPILPRPPPPPSPSRHQRGTGAGRRRRDGTTYRDDEEVFITRLKSLVQILLHSSRTQTFLSPLIRPGTVYWTIRQHVKKNNNDNDYDSDDDQQQQQQQQEQKKDQKKKKSGRPLLSRPLPLLEQLGCNVSITIKKSRDLLVSRTPQWWSQHGMHFVRYDDLDLVTVLPASSSSSSLSSAANTKPNETTAGRDDDDDDDDDDKNNAEIDADTIRPPDEDSILRYDKHWASNCLILRCAILQLTSIKHRHRGSNKSGGNNNIGDDINGIIAYLTRLDGAYNRRSVLSRLDDDLLVKSRSCGSSNSREQKMKKKNISLGAYKNKRFGSSCGSDRASVGTASSSYDNTNSEGTDGNKRRGRPPKWLVEQRKREAMEKDGESEHGGEMDTEDTVRKERGGKGHSAGKRKRTEGITSSTQTPKRPRRVSGGGKDCETPSRKPQGGKNSISKNKTHNKNDKVFDSKDVTENKEEDEDYYNYNEHNNDTEPGIVTTTSTGGTFRHLTQHNIPQGLTRRDQAKRANILRELLEFNRKHSLPNQYRVGRATTCNVVSWPSRKQHTSSNFNSFYNFVRRRGSWMADLLGLIARRRNDSADLLCEYFARKHTASFVRAVPIAQEKESTKGRWLWHTHRPSNFRIWDGSVPGDPDDIETLDDEAVEWNAMYSHLVQYRREHGHCMVTIQKMGSFGRWISQMRLLKMELEDSLQKKKDLNETRRGLVKLKRSMLRGRNKKKQGDREEEEEEEEENEEEGKQDTEEGLDDNNDVDFDDDDAKHKKLKKWDENDVNDDDDDEDEDVFGDADDDNGARANSSSLLFKKQAGRNNTNDNHVCEDDDNEANTKHEGTRRKKKQQKQPLPQLSERWKKRFELLDEIGFIWKPDKSLQRCGPKGDPRMNKAVACRIFFPDLCTRDALLLAGYSEEDATTVKRDICNRKKVQYYKGVNSKSRDAVMKILLRLQSGGKEAVKEVYGDSPHYDSFITDGKVSEYAEERRKLRKKEIQERRRRNLEQLRNARERTLQDAYKVEAGRGGGDEEEEDDNEDNEDEDGNDDNDHDEGMDDDVDEEELDPEVQRVLAVPNISVSGFNATAGAAAATDGRRSSSTRPNTLIDTQNDARDLLAMTTTMVGYHNPLSHQHQPQHHHQQQQQHAHHFLGLGTASTYAQSAPAGAAAPANTGIGGGYGTAGMLPPNGLGYPGMSAAWSRHHHGLGNGGGMDSYNL